MNPERDDIVEVAVWADAYVQAYEDKEFPGIDHPQWWAIERSMFVLRQDAGEEFWEFILAVLARRPSERVLGILAAGPLEDLIAYAGKFFIDRIELVARQDPAFRHLLGGVWRSDTAADVWARAELARGESW